MSRKKKNPLAEGLAAQKSSQEEAPTNGSTAATTRTGRSLVAGHFTPDVQWMLRKIAVDERTTVQALLAEAINHVFASRGKPEIAAASNAAPKAAAEELDEVAQ